MVGSEDFEEGISIREELLSPSQLCYITSHVAKAFLASHRYPTASFSRRFSHQLVTMAATTGQQNKAAWLTTKCGHPFEVGDAPMPTPGENQLTVRTRAVAFNPADSAMQTKGLMIETYPAILGCDAAGEVVAMGAKAAELGFKVGDRVAGCCDQVGDRAGKGVFQLFCNLQVGMVGKIPDGVEFKDAAVLPICLITAAVGLCYEGCLGMPLPKVEPADVGKTILIWGGASSVGSCAIMLAKAAGLKVATTVGAHNFDYAKGIGADYVFDYRGETVVQDITAALKGQGEFAGAFSAVMGPEVYFACAEVCIALGGKQTLSTVLPEFMPFEEKLPGDVKIAYSKTPAISLEVISLTFVR